MDVASLRQKIDTVVIVMLENRSFDHLLGFLSHEDFDARTDVDGLHRQSAQFDFGNPDDAGRIYWPEAAEDAWLSGDPPHGRRLVAEQIRNGNMDGFVTAYLQAHPDDRPAIPPPMRFCRPADVPVSAALARGYCVCDRWFSCLPGDTQSNRNMAVSGYTLIDSTANVRPPAHWIPDQKTILDWLHSKQLPFEIYVDAPAILGVGRPSNFVLMRSQWQHLESGVFGLDELGARWRGPTVAPAVIYCEPYYDTLAKYLGAHGDCNHPPLPVSFGETFLGRVYRSLVSNPERWKRTVLIVCYDEHGGFFDHAEPPQLRYDPPANHEWEINAPFTTVGVRVPGLVISPYAARQSVCSDVLDHTSILQLVVDRFGTSPGDLAFFGAAADRKQHGIQSISAALTLDEPRADIIDLPTPALRLPAASPARNRGAPLTDDERAFVGSVREKAAAAARGGR